MAFDGQLPCRQWSVWRYNWLAHHKLIRVLQRVRHHARGTLLDVGCGSRPYSSIFRGFADRYVGLDLPDAPGLRGPTPDVFGDAERLPVRDGAVDTVLSLAVINLLDEPGWALAEMRRVLTPQGVAILEDRADGPGLPRLARPVALHADRRRAPAA